MPDLFLASEEPPGGGDLNALIDRAILERRVRESEIERLAQHLEPASRGASASRPSRCERSSAARSPTAARGWGLLRGTSADRAGGRAAHAARPAAPAAFYAAARQIYLDAPHGRNGFWTRLRGMQADALFVWGRRDTLVPIAFARHVAEALPHARHIELECGHVPQVELPGPTDEAVAAFFTARRSGPLSPGGNHPCPS